MARRVEAPLSRHGASRLEARALALAALGLALIAITGLASSGSVWEATGAAERAPTSVLQGLAIAGGIVLVGALLLLWVETPGGIKRKKAPRTARKLDDVGTSFWTAGKAAGVALLAFAALCIAVLPLLTSDSTSPPGVIAVPPPADPSSPPSETTEAAESIALGSVLLPIVVALGILVPVAVVVRRRRMRRDREGLAEEPGALTAVRASIDALASERDPRRAILLAYSRMERAFQDVEIVRARDETASEFLDRTARRLDVSAGDAAALTGRFEEARFSTHRLTEADRGEALAALRRVETELAR